MKPEGLSESARRFLAAIVESENSVEEPEPSTLIEYALGLLDDEEEVRVLRWAVLDVRHRELLVAATQAVANGAADDAEIKPILGRYLAGLVSGALSPNILKVTMAGLAQAWASAGPRLHFGFARGTQPGGVVVERNDDGLKVDVRDDAGLTLSLVDPVGGRLPIGGLEFSGGFAEISLPDPGLALDEVGRMINAEHPAPIDELWLPVEGSDAKLGISDLRLTSGGLSATLRTETSFELPIVVSMRLGVMTVEIGSVKAGDLGPTPTQVTWPIGEIAGEGLIPLPGLLVMKVAR